MARSTERRNPSSGGSRKAVFAAMGANLAIAITKFGAALYTGSSSMLAEGIHSIIDTANEGFLLLGMKRAEKPADARHPFGYGVEIYFWSFVVAILIFALGAGFSIFEGVETLLNEDGGAVQAPTVALVVLALSFVFEGISWRVAYKEFNAQRAGNGFIRDLRAMKDPSVFVVLFEDSAACIGILIAAAGVALAWLTGIHAFDAIGSILIGVLLAVTAAILAVETKGLLIGEAASPEMETLVRDRVAELPEIVAVNELRTLHMGPNDVLLTMSVDFQDNVVSQRIEALVSEIETRVRRRFPLVRRVYIEVQSSAGHRTLADAEDGSVAAILAT